MILLVDTSAPNCFFRIKAEDFDVSRNWEAGRELSKDMLAFLRDFMAERGKTWRDISGIVIFRGPGSFTGLRIGHTVLNTIAHSEGVPIVGVEGEAWQEEGLKRLEAGENDQLVMPFYGAEANITAPRK